MSHSIPKAMTIAGSDSSAAAGIQADLKTFSAFGVYGTSVVTAVTAQNTVEVAAIAEVPDEVVIAQIDTVLQDIGTDAIKTGMLSSRSIVQNVADRLEAWGVPHLVVDPVMMSASGVSLLHPNAVAALAKELLPMATIVTPNVAEAEVLARIPITSQEDVREAARRIRDLGSNVVVIEGGHRDGLPTDLVYDGDAFSQLEGTRVESKNMQEVGSTFSAAITALLARGVMPLEAIRLARLYVELAVRESFVIREGHSLLNHAVNLPAGAVDTLATGT